MDKLHICIITAGFPTPIAPAKYTFVDQLACSFADLGVMVSVIAPAAVGKKDAFYKSYWERVTPGGNIISVYHPKMLSFSSKRVGCFRTGILTYYSFMYAVERQIRRLKNKPQILYAHFLVPSGCTAAKIGRKLGMPSFCAFGESGLWSVESVGLGFTRRQLSTITGIVSVSTENKRVLLENKLCREEIIGVFPNGVDHNLFYPRDKITMRTKYGFPLDATIGVYTGTFTENKGVMRVQAATEGFSNLKMIYIGSGNLEPTGSNILFKGKVAHHQIPELLSAADFFILPTLAEGCCNAIIEAMACGLPIISSNMPFNDDILDASYALRVNPRSIEEIRKAISSIIDDKEGSERMGESALQASQKLDINRRAQAILNWMRSKTNNN